MIAEALDAWWAWIAPVSSQAGFVLACAALFDRAFARRAWPALLATAWWLGLVRLVLPPELGSPVSVTQSLGSALECTASAPPSATTAVLFALWIAGACTTLGLRTLARARLKRRCECADGLSSAWRALIAESARSAGLRRAPAVAIVARLESPAVCGAWRARLLLPRRALSHPPRAAERHALLHEMLHIARRDLLADELCALLCAVFWFHPLVWLAARRVHVASELGCDRAVARSLGTADDYRETLLDATQRWLEPPMHHVRAFLGGPAGIVLRLEHLDRASVRPAWLGRAASALLFALVAACVLPMAPLVDPLRAQAEQVFALERRGELQSCFALQAAAQVLAAGSPSTPTQASR
ncbi:MAG: M56 family metallopeptidase [Planctomycetes bacterium]|nr:M56 family metallopeptidase [Planctomycetota bacterium]